MERIRLGTRGSPLALWQARHVAGRLRSAQAGLEVETVLIRTEGDRVTDRPFGEMPGRGFFVKEIEDALLDARVDIAVHSLKDMPTEQPDGLVVAAVLERHDPRDALLSVKGWEFAEIPRETVVATGSPRRRCQLLHARPDLRMADVRGNVDTRVRKLRSGQFGALVLAVAGVERLGVTGAAMRPIPLEVSLPAVGQGAIAIEARSADGRTRALLDRLTHPETLRAVLAERAFLGRLGGGCMAPATAHARIGGAAIAIDAMVGDPDGRRLLRDGAVGDASRGEAIAEGLAERLLAAGGDAILRDARSARGGLA